MCVEENRHCLYSGDWTSCVQRKTDTAYIVVSDWCCAQEKHTIYIVESGLVCAGGKHTLLM